MPDKTADRFSITHSDRDAIVICNGAPIAERTKAGWAPVGFGYGGGVAGDLQLAVQDAIFRQRNDCTAGDLRRAIGDYLQTRGHTLA